MTGVDSAAKSDMLRSLGCDHVIDYTQQGFTRNGKCYDPIPDVKTNRSIFAYARALCPNGSYVTFGGTMARGFQALSLGPWFKLIGRRHIRLVILKPNKDLAYMVELFEAGQVRPVIDRPYKLSEVPGAMRYCGEGKHQGKVVITVVDDNKA